MLVKGKGRPVACNSRHRAQVEVSLYSNSAPCGFWWLTPRPGRSTPGKEPRYPL